MINNNKQVEDLYREQILDSSFLPNIKDIVSNLLLENIGPHAQNYFLNDSSIKSLIDKDATMTLEQFLLQRTIINDFFVNILMVYRTRSSTEIISVLPYLSLEGKFEDWIQLFLKYVIIFLKENSVFDIVAQ